MVVPGPHVVIQKSEIALQLEINGTIRRKIKEAYGLYVTKSLTIVALCPLTQWELMGPIPGVMLLKN